MQDDGHEERTEEYFYKDITNCSTVSDSIPKIVVEPGGCMRKENISKKNIDTSRFAIVVPGDKFYCSMKKSEYSEKAVQGMKAKLREKKG